MTGYNILRITLDTVTWTPVTPPSDCTQCSIENPGAAVIKARTSSGDSATERDIPINGGSLVISAATGSFATAFKAGEAICYLQAASGTGPAVADFTR